MNKYGGIQCKKCSKKVNACHKSINKQNLQARAIKKDKIQSAYRNDNEKNGKIIQDNKQYKTALLILLPQLHQQQEEKIIVETTYKHLGPMSV